MDRHEKFHPEAPAANAADAAAGLLHYFFAVCQNPGDFIDGNITLTAARAAELKAIYGLDQPLLTRYLHWLGQLLRGDLGFSLQYQIPVSQLLNQYIWNSFLLASVALVFYWGIGTAVGVVSALRPGSGLIIW